MIPAFFMAVAALPMTPNGKVDRKALIAPGQQRSRSVRFEAPQTQWQQTLVGLWQEVLNIPKIGIHDNFFELGGHSLKATAFLARLQRETGVRLELVDVFRHPSVAALAAHSAENGRVSQIIVAPIAIAPLDASSRQRDPSPAEADRDNISPATAEEIDILSRL